MLKVFLRFTPPRFSGAVGEDLGLVESRGANFTAYHFDRPAMQW